MMKKDKLDVESGSFCFAQETCCQPSSWLLLKNLLVVYSLSLLWCRHKLSVFVFVSVGELCH